ncbi:MAG: 3-deoxy-D-manno-octulosonic acid transferase [Chthonomonadales bacterium]
MLFYAMYNLALALASPAIAVLMVRRLLAGKDRAGWRERWGHLPSAVASNPAPRLWVHAASVGEVMAAAPVLRLFHEEHPEYFIAISAITQGGYETAQKLAEELGGAAIYAPFDFPFALHRTLGAIRPHVLAVMETELWPNMVFLARRSGAKIGLLNGRISDRSFRRYRVFRRFFAWVMGQFDEVLVQTSRDAQRFQAIGARAHTIKVLGNTKFDQAGQPLPASDARDLRAELHLPADAPVLVVGSTRTADEERHVIAAYIQASRRIPNLALIHAPRHIERAGAVEAMLRDAGLEPVRRTNLAELPGTARQIVLDTYGELAKVYAVCDVAFIGNSLVRPGGGQNLLQPLAQGKPVLFGPWMQNFRDLAEAAQEAGVGWRVDDAEQLAQRIVDLIEDAPRRAEIAGRATALIVENQGASARYVQALAQLTQEALRP